MMRRKNPVAAWLEYAGLRTIAGLCARLPEPVAAWAGRALGRAYGLVGRSRRRIARDNIAKAMPGEHSDAELDRLVKAVFVNLGLTIVETLRMNSRRGARDVRGRFEIEGLDAVKTALAQGRGAIILTSHIGNWELMGGAVAAEVPGLHVLARPVNNPLVREYTTRLRRELGMTVLSTRDGARPMLRALRDGHPLAILMDQHVNRAFVPATFFGRPAATTAVVATLALRLDTPVFAGYSVRQGRGFRHRGVLEGPLELVRTGDREADVLANTQRFNDWIEQAVRRHPEQWLWTHRRWKLADRAGAEES